jgi:hypothetical protein
MNNLTNARFATRMVCITVLARSFFDTVNTRSEAVDLASLFYCLLTNGGRVGNGGATSRLADEVDE